MKFRKNLLCLFTVTFALFLIPLFVQASAVRPLVIQLDANPGDRPVFEFVVSSEDNQETAEISIYHIVQKNNGSNEYQQEASGPVKEWITLDKNVVVVPPGGEIKVTGRVNVPFDAGGSYMAAIMVEPQSTLVSEGITVRYRYAITLIINVQRPGLRPDLTIHSLSLDRDEQMTPIAKAIIQNISPLMFPIAAEMTIRNQNRALIERIELLTGSSKDSDYRSINIFPGAELWLEGKVAKPLFPGEYELRLFLRYADGKQKVHTQMVTVSEGDFAFDESTKYLAINRETLEAKLRPGGAESQILELTNNTNKAILVEISGRDIETEYTRSIFENLQLELRGENILEISPQRSARVVITIRAPREGASGGYYGYISATAYSEASEFLHAYDVPIYAVVGQDHYYEAEVLSSLVTTTNGEQLISVTVKNDSDIHMTPTGICYLKDAESKILRSIPLSLPEGVRDILPYYTGLLVADGLEIPAGEYAAEIKVFVNGKQLAIGEENISIQDQN